MDFTTIYVVFSIMQNITQMYYIIFPFFIVFKYKFKYGNYKISLQEDVIKILARFDSDKIYYISQLNSNPDGFFIGYCNSFILGYVDNTKDDNSCITIFCTESYYKTLLHSSGSINTSNSGDLVVQNFTFKKMNRTGNTEWCCWSQLNSLFLNIKPNQEQLKISKNIYDYYIKNNNCTVLLYGPPGTGKSTISQFLIKKFDNPIFCNSLNVNRPGDCYVKLYNHSNPSKKNPLIILIDEVDCVLKTIKKFSNTQTISHKSLVIADSKTSWNTFMDEMSTLQYVILILTTNMCPNSIGDMMSDELTKKKDMSYLRNGRVHLSFEVKTHVIK